MSKAEKARRVREVLALSQDPHSDDLMCKLSSAYRISSGLFDNSPVFAARQAIEAIEWNLMNHIRDMRTHLMRIEREEP